jgi:uncharacterized phage protein gp47/JayE
MIQQPKTSAAFRSAILDALTQTGIRQLAPGAKARAFADIVGDQLGEMETRQFINLSETLLPYATGISLDMLGDIYGVARLGRQDSQVDAADDNLRFYVRHGTFGDINNGQEIHLPAGVRITSAADGGPVYLTEAARLAAGDSVQAVGVTSYYPGSSGNSASGILTRHNFTGYVDSSYGSLLATNQYGVMGGREAESDDDYRFRIHLKIQSRAGANEAAMRFDILQLPGIQDVVFLRAAGTFTVYVYGISPEISPSLLALVQQQIDDRAAYPMLGEAVAPDLVGISLSTSVRFVAGTAASEQGLILSAASAAAENYINNLPLGATLVINEIADQIRNAHAKILDIGDPNKQIAEIFIWRSRSDGTRFSRFLVGNYTPAVGERILVESRPGAINLGTA